MLISVPPHLVVSEVIRYTKGKSSRKIAGRFPKIKNAVLGITPVNKGIFCSNIRADKRKGGAKIYRRVRYIL
ncbi:MAG: transposase [Alphaproteobacteria bacterium]|nr:transposase [Alphaproteobacteria bacterium]